MLMHVGNVQARPMIMRILLESVELQGNSVLWPHAIIVFQKHLRFLSDFSGASHTRTTWGSKVRERTEELSEGEEEEAFCLMLGIHTQTVLQTAAATDVLDLLDHCMETQHWHLQCPQQHQGLI